MPQAALLKLSSRSLFATCNHGLVANVGNVGATQKWHVPNHPTKKKRQTDPLVRRLNTCCPHVLFRLEELSSVPERRAGAKIRDFPDKEVSERW